MAATKNQDVGERRLRRDVDDIERSDPGRLRSLDGLRGVAALVVVLYHALNAWTPFALEIRRQIPTGPHGSALWWVTATPLSLLFSGGQAVVIFFVLSGIAITLPVLKRRRFDWWAYYPRRAVRLLLPAVASVALAAVWAYATVGYRVPQVNPSLQTDIPLTVTWQSFVRAADISNGELTVNSVLWSLNWELWFSMALPIFVGFAFLVRGRWAIVVAAASIALSWLGSTTNSLALTYQAPFLLGALTAGNFGAVQAAAHRIARRRLDLILGAVLLVFGCACIGFNDWVFAWSSLNPRWASGWFPLGATSLVLVALFWRPARFLLETRLFQWLGLISFSLYLVHLPLISASVAIFGADHWARAVVVAVLLSFAIAVLFQRFVERPSHTLSKRVGAFVSSAVLAAEARRHPEGPRAGGLVDPGTSTGVSGSAPGASSTSPNTTVPAPSASPFAPAEAAGASSAVPVVYPTAPNTRL